MSENRTMTIPAHDGQITSLAASSSGVVASTGHDKYVKLWGSQLPTRTGPNFEFLTPLASCCSSAVLKIA